MNRFFWNDKYSESVRRNWSWKCSQFLRTTFSIARKEGEKPAWIAPTIWTEMLKLWDSEDFKKLSAANKSHRACLKGGFTGGARNTQQHAFKYEKEYKRRMTHAQLMRKVFRKKRTKEWTGTKPPAIIERFNELCKVFKEAHPEGLTEEDKHRLWAEAAGANSKGQMYGQGSLKKVPDFRNPGILPSQAMNVDSIRKSVEDNLRKSIEEEVRRSVTEEVQKTMDDKIQQLLIQTRQQEARNMQVQRAQQMQIQRFVQTFQQMPYVDPLLQADTSFMALLNSTPNPTIPVDSSANAPGYKPPHPASFDSVDHSSGQN